MGRMVVMVQYISRGQRDGVSIPDYRDLVKTMRQVEPMLLLQMKRDFRAVAKPLVQSVKSGIPKQPPTRGIHISRPQRTPSGFNPRVVPGRLTWGANEQNRNKRVDSVLAKTPRVRTKLRNGATETSIARVQVENAAVVMADMAGKSGAWIGKRSVTRPYRYSRGNVFRATGNGVEQLRQHRINGQGRAMIEALNRKGRGSRFVYPAAESSLPAVRSQALNVLKGGFAKVNMKLRS